MQKYIPFHLTQIRGQLGNLFVIKKSKYGYLIKTKCPNMKHIKASKAQKEQREIFKQAVRYAQWIYTDPDRKKAFLKTVKRRKHRAFQYAMKLYLHASPIRQLHLKLTMLKRCLLQSKLQREVTKAKNTYFNLAPWKQLWPTKEAKTDLKPNNHQPTTINAPNHSPLTIHDSSPSTNNHQRSSPFPSFPLSITILD
jgi:hypothetical protein